jgi:hypothetical protein
MPLFTAKTNVPAEHFGIHFSFYAIFEEPKQEQATMSDRDFSQQDMQKAKGHQGFEVCVSYI